MDFNNRFIDPPPSGHHLNSAPPLWTLISISRLQLKNLILIAALITITLSLPVVSFFRVAPPKLDCSSQLEASGRTLPTNPDLGTAQIYNSNTSGPDLSAAQVHDLPHLGSSDADHTSTDVLPNCIPNCKEGIGKNREFHTVGSGAYLFIQMSAYRGGPRDFFIAGLGSKPNHVFSNASFKCEWVASSTSSLSSSPPSSNNTRSIAGEATKMLPDWGYGRVYTVVVVMCNFQEEVGGDSQYDGGGGGGGGELILYASPTSSFETSSNVERIVALREERGDYNATRFKPPYPFEYMYCGSPLFGDLSPQRIREWVAYHVKLFGSMSHFMFYDAGGIHPGVQKVLEPWIKAGRITIENVRNQEKFDGYYHNQFLIANDCLHKTRFLANWTFFFDVDEFLYLPHNSSLQSLLAEHSQFTQIFFKQRPMSSHLCLDNPKANYSEMWGFEKMVFTSMKRGVRRDRKYAIQPLNVLATGVHLSENFKGRSWHIRGEKMRYYHYHGTTSLRAEACQHFLNITSSNDGVFLFENEPFKLDLSMQYLASSIKKFELEHIGEKPFIL